MKVKYFYPNEEGDITFTKEELEKLLNDVYDEGKADGLSAANPWHVPYIVQPYQPIYYNTNTSPKIDWGVYCTDDNSIGRIIIDTDRNTINTGDITC